MVSLVGRKAFPAHLCVFSTTITVTVVGIANFAEHSPPGVSNGNAGVDVPPIARLLRQIGTTANAHKLMVMIHRVTSQQRGENEGKNQGENNPRGPLTRGKRHRL